MKRTSTYLPAKLVAKKLEKHFASHIEAARQVETQQLAPIPSEALIEAIIDTAFWASLRQEEGLSPKISLAFLSPEQAGHPLLFKNRLPLTSRSLIKLAPGVERAGIHLGVWCENDNLFIWGTTRSTPDLCFVLDVSEPGLLVVKHKRLNGFGKYTNVAVLRGDQVKMIDGSSARTPSYPSVLSSLLGFQSSTKDDGVNVLIQMAVSMRKHGHGGTLLVVNAETDTWLDNILHPIVYAVSPAFTALADLVDQHENGRNNSLWKESLQLEVDKIAGFTAIDGATAINGRYELLAFGVKITRKKGSTTIKQILAIEPIIGGVAAIVHPAQLGGTRHLSAAQFVHDQPDALALVASQDGRFTIFSWSYSEGIVQAHQIDSLLI